jgi:phage replication initiation protein
MDTHVINSSQRHDAAATEAPAACGGPRVQRGAPQDGGEVSPRTVIRGESQENGGQSIGIRDVALTDWLNITLPLHISDDASVASFFDRFSAVTGSVFGGMTDRERGLHGWNRSFLFDRGGVVLAFGGQRGTAFLSFSGEGCSFVSDWQPVTALLRDEYRGRITRWDGAVDDFEGIHSVNYAVELYKLGGFKNGGRQPEPKQFGNWLTPDSKGRTFQVGLRGNGKLLRIYEKGKQLGRPESPWVRWEVELHSIERVIPWDVLDRPGEYVAGAYPCLSWVSERASRIRTVKAQDEISYERMQRVGSIAYGALINVMLLREGTAEKVVELLRRDGVPKRLAFTDDYLRVQGAADEL